VSKSSASCEVALCDLVSGCVARAICL
jgi:hypothetical protein